MGRRTYFYAFCKTDMIVALRSIEDRYKDMDQVSPVQQYYLIAPALSQAQLPSWSPSSKKKAQIAKSAYLAGPGCKENQLTMRRGHGWT